MDEINAGDYDQLTYEQIREFYPIEYKKRAEDKLGYRYPNGESYIDLSLRVNESLKKLEETLESKKREQEHAQRSSGASVQYG